MKHSCACAWVASCRHSCCLSIIVVIVLSDTVCHSNYAPRAIAVINESLLRHHLSFMPWCWHPARNKGANMVIKWKRGGTDVFHETGYVQLRRDWSSLLNSNSRRPRGRQATLLLCLVSKVCWYVPPALALPLKLNMTLCHGKCVQGVTYSSCACAWWLLNADAM
jgi:hypothetical protein